MSKNIIKNVIIEGVNYTIPVGYSVHKVITPAMKKAVKKYYESHKEEIKLKNKARAQTPEAKEKRRLYQNERNKKINEAYHARLLTEAVLVDTLMSEVLSD